MPKDSLEWFKQLQEIGALEYVVIVVMAFYGGAVRGISMIKAGAARSIAFVLLSETFVSVFVGLAFAFICKWGGLGFYATVAISSIFAYHGTKSLNLVIDPLKERINKILNK